MSMHRRSVKRNFKAVFTLDFRPIWISQADLLSSACLTGRQVTSTLSKGGQMVLGLSKLLLPEKESFLSGIKLASRLAFLILCVLFISCGQGPKIIDKPIVFDDTREKLSLQYLKERHGLTLEKPIIDPKIIVIHWTVIPTLEKSFEAFNPPELPGSRKGIQQASSLNVSAHFLVDRNGTIYRLLPDTVFARHVIGLNYCAIGIENVADGAGLPLTDAQFEANRKLVDYLTDRHNIEYLIGHDQYTRFIGHPLWKETDPNYLTEKNDVGPEFINQLHRTVKDISLKKAPEPQVQN